MKLKYNVAMVALLVFTITALPFAMAHKSTSNADFNGDGFVDKLDQERIMSSWGSTDNSCYDLNGDGVINVPDLLMLLKDWHQHRR